MKEPVKVNGLFLDYDGTISPLNIPREKSRVPEETAAILNRIKQLIPIGIITAKDMSFIVPKTPFASAWGAVGGLEMKIREKIIIAPRMQATLSYMSLALQYARSHSDKYLFIEEKKDSSGKTIAFCVDWRQSPDSTESENRASQVIAYYERLHLDVIKYRGQPFFDVYPCPIDKGTALAELKRNLGVSSSIMYMGDSKVDNPAFNIADISIGVLHEESHANLTCDYYVKFESVANFLRHLRENDLIFSQNFPEISIEPDWKSRGK
jgi:HAD superfamily hydrolase (TIGR01484 family)